MFVAFCRRCGVSWLAGQLQFLAKNPATRLLIGHSSNILQTHSFIGCYTADGQALPVLRIFKDFYGQKWWHAEVRVGCMSLSLVKAAPAKGASLSLSLSHLSQCTNVDGQGEPAWLWRHTIFQSRDPSCRQFVGRPAAHPSLLSSFSLRQRRMSVWRWERVKERERHFSNF